MDIKTKVNRHTKFTNERTKYYKYANNLMLICKFNAIPNMVLTEFSDDSDKLILQFKKKGKIYRQRRNFWKREKIKPFIS